MKSHTVRGGGAAGAAVLCCLAVALLGFGQQPEATVDPITPRLSTAEVVREMVAMNSERTAALQAYTFIERYHLDYHGLGHDTADMEVRVSFQNPGPKQFTIVSESGSGILRHHVLDPLVKREQLEAEIESQEGSALVPANYAFELVAYPRPGAQPDYILAVTPRRREDRFLFRGKIWLNPVDFGLVRAQGESGHSPSWWVTRYRFTYRSQRVGDFWMPASNACVAHIRLFGHATLDISYQDFNLTSVLPLSMRAAGLLPR
jgi:hypothetical protein